MRVFISYSQKDEAAYSSLCLALEGQGINYWDPKTMRVGASLREQLREGIKKCGACIFLATHNSIDSEWCLAEIGAFWGAGLTVIVFMADSTLQEEQIPAQFKGDLWTRDIRKVIESIRVEIAASEERQNERQRLEDKPKLVSEMTISMFYDFISSIQFSGSRTIDEVLILLREAIHEEQESASAASAYALPLLNRLVGISCEIVQRTGEKYFTHIFDMSINKEKWLVFSNTLIRAPYGDGYRTCLLILCKKKVCVAASIVGSVYWSESKGFKYHSVIASAGPITIDNTT